jgi:predicted enzyme related to lactoylglutathione lyase
MTNPLVHLELHTPNLGRACAFYRGLVGWRTEQVEAGETSYQSLDFGPTLSGGIVECGTERALWLPYIQVASVTMATARAVSHGASVTLAPREGPAGWRSVVNTAEGGEIAFWQMKR